MKLDEDDLNAIELRVERLIQPLKEIGVRHQIAISGDNGDGGLKGDVKSLKKRVGILEKVSYTFTGAVTAFLAFKEKIFGT